MEKVTFGCEKCGAAIEVYPPDMAHTILSLKPSEKGEHVEIQSECRQCHTRNKRYWHEGARPKVVAVRSTR